MIIVTWLLSFLCFWVMIAYYLFLFVDSLSYVITWNIDHQMTYLDSNQYMIVQPCDYVWQTINKHEQIASSHNPKTQRTMQSSYCNNVPPKTVTQPLVHIITRRSNHRLRSLASQARFGTSFSEEEDRNLSHFVCYYTYCKSIYDVSTAISYYTFLKYELYNSLS